MLRTRSTLPALALLSLAGCGGSAGDDTTGPAAERFTATLAGSSVVPATASTSTGTITFEARDSTLNFSLSVVNMTGITQAHVHNAAAGANGATLVWLLPVNGNAAQAPSVTLDGVISLGDISPGWVRGTPRLAMDSVKALMRAGRLYVDVHSSSFGAGEVRGQVARMP
ncbi:MAG: CHRD domain-containing protein [Gemmatimonadaceae bacterium]|nr:CHRD domain-containing protein [Gemmatimonadaceae bacterium]